MRSFDELLEQSATIHGHLCAGQVLGVRMAMVGCREIGIDEPKGCKKLIVYVEIDRCATDAIQAVTGCSLGKRSLKFLDYGKMAATFVNTETGKAVRVLARDDARGLAAAYVNGAANRHEAERQAYVVMSEASLFSLSTVEIEIAPTERPGSRSGRVTCAQCGEGINFKREVIREGKALCVPCARGAYLPRREASRDERPRWFFIGGPSNSGKTTLIENLIPGLAARGYRVGTVKHHHNGAPLAFDAEGKDSRRHRDAGAEAVSLVSSREAVLFRSLQGAAPIAAIRDDFQDFDIVLVEGFHSEPGARIEVRDAHGRERTDAPSDLPPLAVVSPRDVDGRLGYEAGDVARLVDLIVEKILS
ncbi:MAG TPA: molybdopterin-guanine dinucleotide biosynthesis protein B [Verrucomicrobiae bacterium]|nr:molybdopterin-guanine dinucleotide biosynthesis protein B [Verrucomicrobiae bacterium]